MKYLAVLGMVLKCDNATAQAVVQGQPSTKVMAQKKGVYLEATQVMVSGATSGSFVQTAPANGVLNSTAVKVKIENKPPLLEGDKNNAPIIVSLTDPSTGATMTLPITVNIQSAGQTAVQGG